jgi:hypothetical protein
MPPVMLFDKIITLSVSSALFFDSSSRTQNSHKSIHYSHLDAIFHNLRPPESSFSGIRVFQPVLAPRNVENPRVKYENVIFKNLSCRRQQSFAEILSALLSGCARESHKNILELVHNSRDSAVDIPALAINNFHLMKSITRATCWSSLPTGDDDDDDEEKGGQIRLGMDFSSLNRKMSLCEGHKT